jgi:DNA damage-binding protein 1
VVTCSGAFKDGSLRFIRNGVGINEQAAIELPGIKGIWSLRPSTDTEFYKYIVLAFVGQTRILEMNGEELSELETGDAGFISTEQTLFCGNVVHNQFIQVTPKAVYLINSANLKLMKKWTPPPDVRINVASANASQLLIGTSGGHLIYLQVEDNVIKEISYKSLPFFFSLIY